MLPVPADVGEVDELDGAGGSGQRPLIAAEATGNRLEVSDESRIGRIHTPGDPREQTGQRVRYPSAVPSLERLQAVDRRARRDEDGSLTAQAASRPEHEIGPVEVAGGVRAGPHRLAEPVCGALHAATVPDRDEPVPPRALRQPC